MNFIIVKVIINIADLKKLSRKKWLNGSKTYFNMSCSLLFYIIYGAITTRPLAKIKNSVYNKTRY